MSESIQTLNRKRASLKSKLTQFANYVKLLSNNLENGENLDELDLIQLNERLGKITDTLLSDFDELQTAIESVAENVEEQFSERETFESSYYNQVSLAKQIIKKYEHSNNLEQAVAVKHTKNVEVSGIKLPEVDLPKFNGELTRWLEFRDTFRSLIHENESIQPIHKFHYLRASMVGKAAEFLKSEEFSEANYEGAWKAVLERFDNKRILIDQHIKALFSLEPVQKESSEKIRNLIHTVWRHLRDLEKLEQSTNNWDALIIHLVITKLDATSSRKWESHKTKNVSPKLDDLKGFLKERAEYLESLEAKKPEQVEKKT